MRFAMKTKIIQGRSDYIYLVDYNNSLSVNADDAKANDTWTLFSISMEENASTYTAKIYSIDKGDPSATRLRTLTDITMTKLGDFFSVFAWEPVGVYSTPVYIG